MQKPILPVRVPGAVSLLPWPLTGWRFRLFLRRAGPMGPVQAPLQVVGVALGALAQAGGFPAFA
jgi:hypothetical protein